MQTCKQYCYVFPPLLQLRVSITCVLNALFSKIEQTKSTANVSSTLFTTKKKGTSISCDRQRKYGKQL